MLNNVIPMGSPLWGSAESNKTSLFFTVKQQQIRIKQNEYLPH